jgi:hypothetical protein
MNCKNCGRPCIRTEARKLKKLAKSNPCRKTRPPTLPYNTPISPRPLSSHVPNSPLDTTHPPGA